MVMAIDKFLSLDEQQRQDWIKEIEIQSKKRPRKATTTTKSTTKKTTAKAKTGAAKKTTKKAE